MHSPLSRRLRDGVSLLGTSLLYLCLRSSTLPYTTRMQVTLDLPDELSSALAAYGPDLPRAALEAIALEAYRERKLTTSQLRRLLGFQSRYELDGYLKQHEVWLDYTWQDLEQDRQTHRRLGL